MSTKLPIVLDRFPLFDQPDSDDTAIWHYMDFTKLVSLLDRSELFFARLDKLGDRFEGSFPRPNIEDQVLLTNAPPGMTQEIFDQLRTVQRQMQYEWFRMIEFVSCWHVNLGESVAMWKLYLKSDEGIAIRSTVGRLKASMTDVVITPAPREELRGPKMVIGMVRYIDYHTEHIPEDNYLAPAMYKMRSFQHEHELRAVIVDYPLLDHVAVNGADPHDTGRWV